MGLYRKKSKTVEAEQIFIDPITGLHMGPLPFASRNVVCHTAQNAYYVVTAHKQSVYLANHDWITPEPNGDGFYPIKDEIFKQDFVAFDPRSNDLETILAQREGQIANLVIIVKKLEDENQRLLKQLKNWKQTQEQKHE